MEPQVKKRRHRLTNMVYDEVSLVDKGANQHAHVLIVKRQDDGPSSNVPAKERKANWYASDREATESGSGKGKKSQRAQNWNDGKHPRKKKGSPAGGEFDKTSDESKKKYGKGGTTKEKQEKGTATHKTVKGDTLWDLAVKHYGDGTKWKLIAQANGIKDPKKLPIGMSLKIPGSKLAKPPAKGAPKTRTVMEPGGRVHEERVPEAKKKNPVAKSLRSEQRTGVEKMAADFMFMNYTDRR